MQSPQLYKAILRNKAVRPQGPPIPPHPRTRQFNAKLPHNVTRVKGWEEKAPAHPHTKHTMYRDKGEEARTHSESRRQVTPGGIDYEQGRQPCGAPARARAALTLRHTIRTNALSTNMPRTLKAPVAGSHSTCIIRFTFWGLDTPGEPSSPAGASEAAAPDGLIAGSVAARRRGGAGGAAMAHTQHTRSLTTGGRRNLRTGALLQKETPPITRRL